MPATIYWAFTPSQALWEIPQCITSHNLHLSSEGGSNTIQCNTTHQRGNWKLERWSHLPECRSVSGNQGTGTSAADHDTPASEDLCFRKFFPSRDTRSCRMIRTSHSVSESTQEPPKHKEDIGTSDDHRLSDFNLNVWQHMLSNQHIQKRLR